MALELQGALPRVRAAAVQRGLARRDIEKIARVGLEEKSFGRGHHYGTVLIDLDHRRVLEVVEHRTQASAQRKRPPECLRTGLDSHLTVRAL